jgi:hypothetical protein
MFRCYENEIPLNVNYSLKVKNINTLEASIQKNQVMEENIVESNVEP